MTDWKAQATSADAAVSCVRSGMRVFVHGAAATPSPLVDALARRTDLADVTLYHLHTTGPAPFAAPNTRAASFPFRSSPRRRCAGSFPLHSTTRTRLFLGGDSSN